MHLKETAPDRMTDDNYLVRILTRTSHIHRPTIF